MSAYSLDRDLDEAGAGGISDTMYAKYVSGPWGGFMRKLFKGPSTSNTTATTTATTALTTAGSGNGGGSGKSVTAPGSGKKPASGTGIGTGAGAGAGAGANTGHGSHIIKSRSYLDHMKNKANPGVAVAPTPRRSASIAVAKIKPRRHFDTQYTWLPQLLVKGG